MNPYIKEDVGIFDLTTEGLGIGELYGKISFSARDNITLCGLAKIKEIFKSLGMKLTSYKKDGEPVAKDELIAKAYGVAANLHKAWKISQNILEYQSGIATLTRKMVDNAKEINPDIEVSTTRKNYPSAKKSMVEAVVCGGGQIHRLGLYDSILVFKEHLEFFKNQEELETGFQNLKKKFLEKKIAIEIDSFENANYFAALGADILQCEKMSLEELEKCVNLKAKYSHLLVSATGGVNLGNVAEYAKTGVDFIVTSAPYHAKPVDINVKITHISETGTEALSEKIRNFLLQYANTREAALLADTVAQKSILLNHLYQDMGFKSRSEMSDFMSRHYPSLADKKPKEIRWKKFLYDCIEETAPACGYCKDIENCFSCELAIKNPE